MLAAEPPSHSQAGLFESLPPIPRVLRLGETIYSCAQCNAFLYTKDAESDYRGLGDPPPIAPRAEHVRTADTIHARIYDAIVEQRLPPGTKLGEETLCEIFGVSRTMIRRVLQRLASEHVVEARPHRGAFVARPSVEEAREVFEARRTSRRR